MNQHVRTPKSVTLTLAGGFIVGAVCMAAVHSGAGLDVAQAAPQIQIKPRLMSSSATESLTELHNLDSSFRYLAKFVAPAVVDIQTESKRAMGTDGTRMPVTEGEGSGFLFSPDGYIATNDHVVGTADTVKVTLKDGHEFTGKVIRGNDINSDIALVKIEGKDLPYLSFADSNQVDPGEFAMAIGAPFGLKNSVSIGHVSALGRSNQIGNRVYTDLLQTDAAINMGNSGGPLVNIDGQVIGMNTAIYSPTGGSNGIGFAIPGNQVHLIENLLVTKGKITRSMLGVFPDDVKEYERTQAGSQFPNGGARVHDITAGSPAAVAGIQKDDVIVKIGTTDIHGQLDLRNAMLSYAPNTKVSMEYIRGGQRHTTQVTLKPFELPKIPANQGQPGQKFYQFDPFGNNGGSDGEGPDLSVPFGNQRQFGNPFGGPGQGAPSSPMTGKAILGVQVQDVDATAHSQYGIPAGIKGAVVVTVAPGSTAAQIGMQDGDVIQAINGKAITSSQDLRDAMKSVKPGSIAHISFSHFDNGVKLKTDRDVKF